MIEETTWLQVEATTKCNAWCAGCGRNNGGYGLKEDLVLEDLDIEIFESSIKQMGLPHFTMLVELPLLRTDYFNQERLQLTSRLAS